MLRDSYFSGGWHIHVGDPTVIGWAIFVGYLAATVLCFTAAASARPSSRHARTTSALFWLGLAVVMLMLGLNKQLDLQELLIIVGRNVASVAGLFGERREIQRLFVIFSGAGGGLIIAGTSWYFRRELTGNPLAMVGAAILAAFVFTRAASINHVDLFPSGFETLGPIPLKYAFECAGILLVAFGAWFRIRWYRGSEGGNAAVRSSRYP